MATNYTLRWFGFVVDESGVRCGYVFPEDTTVDWTANNGTFKARSKNGIESTGHATKEAAGAQIVVDMGI